MAQPDRPEDPPTPSFATRATPVPTPATPGRTDPTDEVRARFLHASFFAPDDGLLVTLPPDDPDAEVASAPILFVWRTRVGVQPVIMPLWRRLD